ncbi:hypothetical protein V6x_13840 [Gimesia chilikensis]|uniref:Uncharacterized protein n=1 Tax=Gimesia chilikensis TaxID=2605989 RepID=A0A517W8W4_9PLAN|nr:hypothetical protein V6x_13840 [Gimesia chilikensis]
MKTELNWILTIFLTLTLTLTLLLACLVTLRERRLRRALQQVLKHILKRWRPHDSGMKNADSEHPANADHGRDSLRK